MKIENRNSLLQKIGKLRKRISIIPKHLRTYEVQLLPGETIEQARQRLEENGMKMSARKIVVYLPAESEGRLGTQVQ